MEHEEQQSYQRLNCAQTTDKAPLFRAQAFDPIQKEIKRISLEDYREKWVILFFYSSDFTFV
ncbi:redoxin domain-containing protein [Alkalihalobacillus hwajinpoensis]|nr:redoxin domain-containing protein [Pseudalkalibacillus hwajinpoensis]